MIFDNFKFDCFIYFRKNQYILNNDYKIFINFSFNVCSAICIWFFKTIKCYRVFLDSNRGVFRLVGLYYWFMDNGVFIFWFTTYLCNWKIYESFPILKPSNIDCRRKMQYDSNPYFCNGKMTILYHFPYLPFLDTSIFHQAVGP